MNIQNKKEHGTTGRVIIFLVLGLCISGCLSSSSEEGAIGLKIMKKEVIPSEFGECIYRAEMSVTNNGTTGINPLTIIVEVHDLETGKSAAITTIDVPNLDQSESRNLSVALSTHCRANYTLRAYARY